MKKQHIVLGKLGENLAQKFLKKQRYKILKTNFKTPRGEIDIIAYDGKTLVFIEVKTRKSKIFGIPAEAVNFTKQRKLRQMALTFLAGKEVKTKEFRFDVVEIIFDNKALEPEINLIKNAF